MGNPRLKDLKRLNMSFCFGASEFRWEVSPGVWTKKNFRGWNVEDIGWARSIKYNEKNKYMFVMDIDGNGIDSSLLIQTYILFRKLEEMTGVTPFIKASGQSGTHIVLPIKFPGTWGEDRVFQTMKDIAYTVYTESDVRGLNIGRAEKRPFIDTHMFERGRLVRGLSVHMGSGKYSVPILPGENLNTVNRRMLLLEDIPKVDIGTFFFKDIELMEYEDKKEYEKKSMEPSMLTPLYMSSMKWTKKGDRWYRLLPPQLKVICNMDVDIQHMFTLFHVSYLVYYYGMTPPEIHKWLNSNVRWKDYNPDSRETIYNINYIYRWVKTHTSDNEFYGFDDRVPIPLNLWEPSIKYDEIWSGI